MKNRTNLTVSKNKKIFYKINCLKEIKAEIEEFLQLEENKHMFTKSFAQKMMLPFEIKFNNYIEGYIDDIDTINQIISSVSLNTTEEKRIYNLYQGYQYIFNTKDISAQSLKHLYSILSDGLLEQYDMDNMGDFYRKKDVYILPSFDMNISGDTGINCNQIETKMNLLFEYINSDESNDLITEYVKSQIIHFYIVYIHPYFDVNGRMARTLSMQYLLNKQAYPFIIFNRAILSNKHNYRLGIKKGKTTANITLFLKFMLENLKTEIEKEYVISSISHNQDLSIIDYQSLQLILSMKNPKTLINFTKRFNYHYSNQDLSLVYEKMIKPLLDKNILSLGSSQSSTINSLTFQFNYKDIDQTKIKRLIL